MHRSRLLLATTALLPSLAMAVSLSDFAPHIDSSTLTPSCAGIYDAPIAGCTPQDFAGSGGICSRQCVGGILSTANNIYTGCSTYRNDNQGIISAFLAGKAVTSLCADAGTQGRDESSSSSSLSASLKSPSAYGPLPSLWPAPSPQAYVPLNVDSSFGSSINGLVTATEASFTTSSTATTSSSTSSSTTSSSSSSSSGSTSSSTTSVASSPTTSSEVRTSGFATTPMSATGPNNHPTILPSTGVLSQFAPLSTAAQTTSASVAPDSSCVPSGGGGSIIGNQGCREDASTSAGMTVGAGSAAVFALVTGVTVLVALTLG